MGITKRFYLKSFSSIRLLIIVVCFFSQSIVCAENNLTFPSIVEKNEIANIELIVKKSSPFFLLDLRNLELNSSTNFSVLGKKYFESETEKKLIFNIIIQEIGKHTFNFLLPEKNNENLSFAIQVINNSLNQATKFTWEIFTEDGKKASSPLTQGETYYLNLIGDFNFKTAQITNIELSNLDNFIIIQKNDTIFEKDYTTQVLSLNVKILFFDKITLPKVTVFYLTKNESESTLEIESTQIDAMINSRVFEQKSENKKEITIEQNNTFQDNTSEKLSNPISKSKKETILNLYDSILRSKKSFSLSEIKQTINLQKELNAKKIKVFFPKSFMFFLTIPLIFIILASSIFLKKRKFIFAFLVLLCSVLTIFTFTKQSKKYGLLFFETEIEIFNIPEKNAKVKGTRKPGEIIEITTSNPPWLYIKTLDGKTGWIDEKKALVIP